MKRLVGVLMMGLVISQQVNLANGSQDKVELNQETTSVHKNGENKNGVSKERLMRENLVYLKVVQEMLFNVWTGFLEGFQKPSYYIFNHLFFIQVYDRDPHLRRGNCMGDSQLSLILSTMNILESYDKENMFIGLAQTIGNGLEVAKELRSHCKVESFLEDISSFCEDNCKGRKMIQRLKCMQNSIFKGKNLIMDQNFRLSRNFNQISKVYKSIIRLLYDSEPENILAELKIAAEVGGKMGEMMRMTIGFKDNDKALDF